MNLCEIRDESCILAICFIITSFALPWYDQSFAAGPYRYYELFLFFYSYSMCLPANKLQAKILLFVSCLEIVPPQMKTEILKRLQDALIFFKRTLKTPAGSRLQYESEEVLYRRVMSSKAH